MRRTVSLVSSMLAVVLLVVGCADSDTSKERQESQTGGLTAAGAGDDGPPNGTMRESAERPDQPDGSTESRTAVGCRVGLLPPSRCR